MREKKRGEKDAKRVKRPKRAAGEKRVDRTGGGLGEPCSQSAEKKMKHWESDSCKPPKGSGGKDEQGKRRGTRLGKAEGYFFNVEKNCGDIKSRGGGGGRGKRSASTWFF